MGWSEKDEDKSARFIVCVLKRKGVRFVNTSPPTRVYVKSWANYLWVPCVVVASVVLFWPLRRSTGYGETGVVANNDI